MLASITNFLNNTDALEFKTVPAIRVTASRNLGKSVSEVVQTDRRHKFGIFDENKGGIAEYEPFESDTLPTPNDFCYQNGD